MNWLISFLILFFGFWIVTRTLQRLISVHHVIEKSSYLVSKRLFVLLSLLFLVLSRANPLWNLSYVAIFFIGIGFVSSWIRMNREKRFAKELPGVLDRAILHMKVGKSFRVALEAAACESQPFMRTRMMGICESIQYDRAQNLRKCAHDRPTWERELTEIGLQPHRGLVRLEAFRSRLRSRERFRRRSGQAAYQAKAQALLLALLYAGLLVFSLHQYAWDEVRRLVLWSMSLFTVGSLFILVLGRKKKWKI